MWVPTQRGAEKGIALITALLILLLLTSLAAGFTLLVTNEQQSNGLDLDHTKTFYAAYGAMEQLNAQVGTLFFYNPQHVTAGDIKNAIAALPPLPGVNLVDPSNYCPSGDYTGTYNGYCVNYEKDANGNPKATTGLITEGPYQGFQGLITNYTITINAQSTNFSLTTDEAGNTGTNRFGSEIRLRRTFQTVAIPVFQFGIFSQTDLSFFPGPNFNFGGKVATNGDLYLAGGNSLVMSDKVSAYGDVIRDRLSNGYSGSAYTSAYGGSVYPTASPSGPFTGTPPPPVPPYRSLAFTEGSISGGPSGGCNTTNGNPVNSGVTPNSSWTTISLSNYNGNLRDGAYGCPRGTGAKNLQLPLLSPTAVSQGATAIALIKQPPASENPNTSPIFPYRFFSYPTGAGYAMLRILIADTPGEILAEPTVSGPLGSVNGYPVPLFCKPVSGSNPCTTLDTGSSPANSYAGNPVTSGVQVYTSTATGYAPCLPINSALCVSAIVNGAVSNSASKTLPPWAASGGVVNAMQKIGSNLTGASLPEMDWYVQGQPRLWGYIKIDYQDPGTGGWTDVTQEILSLGTTGRNLSSIQYSAANNGWLVPSGSGNPGNPAQGVAGNGNGVLSATAGSVSCFEPHPNAVLRFQRLNDVPSGGGCGYTNLGAGACPTATNTAACGMSTTASDYIPLMLYDPRAGLLRDTIGAGLATGFTTPSAPGNKPGYYLTASGAIYYVELDVTNLARWFTGTIGKTGRPAAGTTGYLVYFSDRRGNQPCAPTANCPGGVQQKLGNLGFEDIINPLSSTSTPNGVVDTGEDLNGANATLPGQAPVSMPLDTYGQVPVFNCYPLNTGCPAPPTPFTNSYTAPYPMPSQLNSTALLNTSGATAACNTPVSLTGANTPKTGNPNRICPSQATQLYTNTGAAASPYTALTIEEARDNPPLFFRRALKLTDAQAYNLGNCGTSIPCGLTIASENSVYVEGNFNATGTCCPVAYAGTDYPSAIIADAVTLLSTQWNDLNSFTHPYDLTTSGGASNPGRAGNTTYYRMGVLAGKGLSFPQPTVGVSPQDFGTDGGVHNFLRYIENWGGTLAYTGSIASFYFNTQAVGIYKCCNTVYSPPTRGYSFNTNYLTPTLLPPRTPAFTDTNTLGFTQLVLPGQQ
jgi:Tfp pilus assembly protein PilX